MNRTLSIAAIAAVLGASASFAQTTVGIEQLDLNGDNLATLGEVMTVYPRFDPVDFDILDKDGDRYLTGGELGTGEAASLFTGLQAAEAATYNEREYTVYTLDSLDTDGDGIVTYEELNAAVPGMTQDVYLSYDRNADQGLDATEIRSGRFQNTINQY